MTLSVALEVSAALVSRMSKWDSSILVASFFSVIIPFCCLLFIRSLCLHCTYIKRLATCANSFLGVLRTTSVI